MPLPIPRHAIPNDTARANREEKGCLATRRRGRGRRSGGREGGAEGVIARTDFEDPCERDGRARGDAFELGDGEDVVGGEEVAAAEEEGGDVVRGLGGEKREGRGGAVVVVSKEQEGEGEGRTIRRKEGEGKG